MHFQLNITLTEEDYLAFNIFHSFESANGKKLIQKSRIFFIGFMALLMVIVLFTFESTTFSIIYATVLGSFTALYMLAFRKILERNMKVQIKRLKKTGKLPFEPVSTLEFYEDTLVEITASKRTEQNYHALERMCVVADRFILLYHSSVAAYILPMPQVKAQTNQDDLLSFLSGKCNTMERY